MWGGRHGWISIYIHIYIYIYYLGMVYGSDLIELLESGRGVVVESGWLTWAI